MEGGGGGLSVFSGSRPCFFAFVHLLVSSFWSLAPEVPGFEHIDSGTLVQTDAQPYLYIKSLGKIWLQKQKKYASPLLKLEQESVKKVHQSRILDEQVRYE